jgi:hypothetical protein
MREPFWRLVSARTVRAWSPETRMQLVYRMRERESCCLPWTRRVRSFGLISILKSVGHESIFVPNGKRIVCCDTAGNLTALNLTGTKPNKANLAFDPEIFYLSGLAASPDGAQV